MKSNDKDILVTTGIAPEDAKPEGLYYINTKTNEVGDEEYWSNKLQREFHEAGKKLTSNDVIERIGMLPRVIVNHLTGKWQLIYKYEL